MDYLEKFKEKCKLNNDFMEKLDFLFERLIHFGYIDRTNLNRLSKKLYNNINAVFLTSDKVHDYKTGYYDAITKELYIKDTNDLESFFLRIIYAITTSQKKEDVYTVGYSTTSLSKLNYKQEHKNYGLNRAVVSNLVCRLLYTEPTTLSIVPTYRTYKKDFLGNGIDADNNIYFLEGQILKQMCFALNIQEEDLYYHLFVNPVSYLNKILAKCKVENPDQLLAIFDRASKNYSNYNKLLYYNRLLDENYLSTKKTLPNEEIDESLIKEQEKLNFIITKTILDIKPQTDEDSIEDVELSLNEVVNELEENMIKDVINIQNILVDTLIISENRYSPILFTVKQKQLSKLLIFKNEKLENSIYNTITYKILNTFESTSSNLIEKMKYSIASEVLSSEKYIKIYNNMEFNRLTNLDLDENTEIMALSVDNTFLQLIKVKDLNLPFKELKDNTEIIKIDNLKFLLNSPMSISSTQNIEKVYTYIKTHHEKYKTIEIEKLYITNINDTTLVLVLSDDDFEIFKMDILNDEVNCIKVSLSETYGIFNSSSVSYSNKSYKNQPTETAKVFGIF
ncbi:MAG: hypothetical protein ACI4ON_06315 [Clostridia bacterium]